MSGDREFLFDDPVLQAWAEHRKRLLNYAYRFTGSLELAEDVVQEVALAIRGGTAHSSPLALLYITAGNLARRINQGYAIEGRRYRPLIAEDQLDFDPSTTHADDVVAASLDLNHALQQISEGHREVVILTSILGYKEREVAEMLGLPLGTVKNHKRIAKKALRSHLQVVA